MTRTCPEYKCNLQTLSGSTVSLTSLGLRNEIVPPRKIEQLCSQDCEYVATRKLRLSDNPHRHGHIRPQLLIGMRDVPHLLTSWQSHTLPSGLTLTASHLGYLVAGVASPIGTSSNETVLFTRVCTPPSTSSSRLSHRHNANRRRPSHGKQRQSTSSAGPNVAPTALPSNHNASSRFPVPRLKRQTTTTNKPFPNPPNFRQRRSSPATRAPSVPSSKTSLCSQPYRPPHLRNNGNQGSSPFTPSHTVQTFSGRECRVGHDLSSSGPSLSHSAPARSL